ncbi:F0F1 ATP synthase subunit B [Candidatus Liberibacter americanus]|uniref:ATP synthase subunit b n=1 Tax=Candidatus Liberibacter americanus str. Sao Paulo TaxID=1261131 RepID=U6B7N6_9HYPH|nr:F0F1 ATP synthase subunit B [Candidatus Liberibacter americanus]AHA27876.1 ATP synthase B' chain [Candidatus Liberibacter americanus str. Sao Paulo]EMS35919.1 F0F1 ATP synthase subunit B [Candidatus Liberibacter americanus PW_SP]
MYISDTFLVFISLVIFVFILIYIRVPYIVFSFLDARADSIRNDIFVARRLREETEAVLIEHQRRFAQVKQEASDIILSAERRVKIIEEENQKKIEKILYLRLLDLKRRMHLMELDAFRFLYDKLSVFSIEISKGIISDNINDDLNNDIFDKAIRDIDSRFN